MKKSSYLLAVLLLTGCAAAYPDDELAEYDIPDRPYTTPMTTDGARESASKPRASDIFKTKIVSAEQAAKDAADVQGRFGQKEKRFLRKGLNAPADSMKYDESVPQPSVEVVRGLEVKPLNKEAEQKILDGIVASQPQPATAPEAKKDSPEKTDAEPAPAVSEKVDAPAAAVPAAAPVKENPIVLTAPSKEESIVLTAPASKKNVSEKVVAPAAPAPEKEETIVLTAPVEEKPIVLTAPSKEERIVLTAPEKEESIVLTAPASKKNVSEKVVAPAAPAPVPAAPKNKNF